MEKNRFPRGESQNLTSENRQFRKSNFQRILKRFQSPNLKPLAERIVSAKTNKSLYLEQIEIKITLEEGPAFLNYLKILPSRRVYNPEQLKTHFIIIYDTNSILPSKTGRPSKNYEPVSKGSTQ